MKDTPPCEACKPGPVRLSVPMRAQTAVGGCATARFKRTLAAQSASSRDPHRFNLHLLFNCAPGRRLTAVHQCLARKQAHGAPTHALHLPSGVAELSMHEAPTLSPSSPSQQLAPGRRRAAVQQRLVREQAFHEAGVGQEGGRRSVCRRAPPSLCRLAHLAQTQNICFNRHFL